MVVPSKCRQQLQSLAHEGVFAGNFRRTKTYSKLVSDLFIPFFKFIYLLVSFFCLFISGQECIRRRVSPIRKWHPLLMEMFHF